MKEPLEKARMKEPLEKERMKQPLGKEKTKKTKKNLIAHLDVLPIG